MCAFTCLLERPLHVFAQIIVFLHTLMQQEATPDFAFVPLGKHKLQFSALLR